MAKTIKVRKTGNSLVITIPSDIAGLYGISKGSELEISPFTSDSLQLKIKK